MPRVVSTLLAIGGWLIGEHVKDYRDNFSRIYELRMRTATQINQIILTVSVASLTAIAALNERVFNTDYNWMAFVVVILFMSVILMSVINLYISRLALTQMQRKLTDNFKSFRNFANGMENSIYAKAQRLLNTATLTCFCLGLIALIVLMGMYILLPGRGGV